MVFYIIQVKNRKKKKKISQMDEKEKKAKIKKIIEKYSELFSDSR